MGSKRSGVGRRCAQCIAGVGLLALLGACDSGGADPLTVSVEDGTPGHYGGPCSPDGNCGDGLACRHHVCVEVGD